MTYVDSCIAMYLVGSEHPNKAKAIRSAEQLIQGNEELVTSAEAFQEILHRYRSLQDFKSLGLAYEALDRLADRVFAVEKRDADAARALLAEHRKLSSRDCIHASVMKRIGCDRIWTFDAGFDALPFVSRIA